MKRFAVLIVFLFCVSVAEAQITSFWNKHVESGKQIKGAQGKKLVVPVEQRHVAKRLMETELRPGTTNNDIWSVKENNDLSDGYVVLAKATYDYPEERRLDNAGASTTIERNVDKVTEVLHALKHPPPYPLSA